jgi:hypothetical protein
MNEKQKRFWNRVINAAFWESLGLYVAYMIVRGWTMGYWQAVFAGIFGAAR